MKLSQKRKDLKTALKAFFITFICCLAAFLLVALISVQKHEDSISEENYEKTTGAVKTAKILFIYNSDDLRFVEITLSLGSSEFACREVTDSQITLDGRKSTLADACLSRGKGAATEAYESFIGEKLSGYIAADSAALKRMIDRFGGLDGEDGFAVNGDDALALIETEGLDRVIYKTVSRFFSPYLTLSLKNRFLYIISVSESNLTYAQYHQNAEYLEITEEGQQ